MDLTLIIMAAGMGSRFGGIKQIEPIGPNGEIIMDYSIFDAKRAGFNKIVFVIKKDIEQQFKERIYNRIEKHIPATCVFQDLDDLPPGFSLPQSRIKPWGTGHAVYAARNAVTTPFMVINADDFYGAEAYDVIANELRKNGGDSRYNYCMAGYQLENTLSEEGHVSRGICAFDAGNYLTSVTERTKILKENDQIFYEESGAKHKLNKDTVVSLNCWGLTTEFFGELETQFSEFLSNGDNNLETKELYLPYTISSLLEQGKASVKVLTSNEKWYGFTYKEDKEIVVNAVAEMIAEGKYPKNLF